MKIAALEENQAADARPVMDREALDIEDDSGRGFHQGRLSPGQAACSVRAMISSCNSGESSTK
jgi:hypothetical protein